MAEEVAIDLNIKTGAAEKNTQSLKSKLKELKSELAGLDEGSEAFNKIAAEAGKVQDKIGDLNKKVNTLASDTRKLDAVVGVAQGIAGGFAAAQGAAALFGVESEDLNKQLLKVQASLALLNGIQAIANTLQKESAVMTTLSGAAMTIYTYVTSASTVALKAFRIALISTGIGAIIVLIGTLIANWDALTKAISGSALSAEDAKKKYDALNTTLEGYDKLLARIVKNLEAQGASQERIFSEQAQNIIDKVAVIKEENEKLVGDINKSNNKIDEIAKNRMKSDESYYISAKELTEKKKEANKEIVNLIYKNNLLIEGLENDLSIMKLDAEKKRTEAVDASAKEAAGKREDEYKTLTTKEAEAAAKKEEAAKAEAERLLALQTQFNEAAAQDKADAEAKKKELEQAGADEATRIKKEANAEQLALDNLLAENEKKNIAEVAAAKKKAIDDGFKIAQAASNALSSLNALITQSENQNRNKSAKERLALEKKQFERGKALAIVNTIINTSQAIMAQMGAGPVGIALAVLAGVTGAIQIATIASQKFDGGSGSLTPPSSSAASSTSTSPTNSAPQIPQTPQSIPIPQQVFVTETDITGVQGRVNVIENLSKVG